MGNAMPPDGLIEGADSQVQICRGVLGGEIARRHQLALTANSGHATAATLTPSAAATAAFSFCRWRGCFIPAGRAIGICVAFFSARHTLKLRRPCPLMRPMIFQLESM